MLLIRLQCGYAASMISRACSGSSIRRSRITRILMLVLGVLAVPSVGTAAMQRPHCAQHDTAPGAQTTHGNGAHHTHAPNSSTTWQSGSQHDCPHCPPTECAQIAPCTTSPTATIVEGSGTVIPLMVRTELIPKLPVQPGSTTHEPPTPPPQQIS